MPSCPPVATPFLADCRQTQTKAADSSLSERQLNCLKPTQPLPWCPQTAGTPKPGQPTATCRQTQSSSHQACGPCLMPSMPRDLSLGCTVTQACSLAPATRAAGEGAARRNKGSSRVAPHPSMSVYETAPSYIGGVLKQRL